MPYLIYNDDLGNEQRYQIPPGQQEIKIGRAPDSQVLFNSLAVGRKHGKIVVGGGAYLYYDLGTINGTRINGQKVPPEKPIPLNDQDEIAVGDRKIRFVVNLPRPAEQKKPIQQRDRTLRDAGDLQAVEQEEVVVAQPKIPPRAEPKIETKAVDAKPAEKPVTAQDAAVSLVELRRLQKENAALRAELQNVTAKAQSYDPAEIAQLKNKLEELRKILAEKDNEIRYLKGVAQDAERMRKEAESRAATANANLSGLLDKNAALREQIRHLESQIESIRAETSEKDAIVAELRDKISELNVRLEQARGKGGEAVEIIAGLKVKLAEKEREIERLKRDLDIREYDYKSLKEEVEQLREITQSDAGRHGELDRKVRNLEAIIDDNRNLISELRRIIEDKDRDIQALRHGVGMDDLEREHQRLLDDFHKKSREVDSLREQTASLKADFASVSQEKEKLLEKVRQLEESLRAKKSEIEDISDHPDYKAKLREIEKLKEELQRQEEELDKESNEIQKLLAKVQSLEEIKLSYEQEISSLRKEIAESKAREGRFPKDEQIKMLEEVVSRQLRNDSVSMRLDIIYDEMARKAEARTKGMNEVASEELKNFLMGISEAIESLLDSLLVLDSGTRDITRFLFVLGNKPLDQEARQALRGASPNEAAQTLRDIQRVLALDTERLRTAWRDGEKFWKEGKK